MSGQSYTESAWLLLVHSTRTGSSLFQSPICHMFNDIFSHHCSVPSWLTNIEPNAIVFPTYLLRRMQVREWEIVASFRGRSWDQVFDIILVLLAEKLKHGEDPLVVVPVDSRLSG
eukprot:gnl/MRDRNA2_/MRDRNA2_38578_c0_seq2.p2 gnl/MRDRNA2_/MRDRNA2_38578_c0~~gnl/MRDRNA2_/MRDRNA2_38578_c0_seq2.p2  ORF type:complete len:122 (-),score=8.82 gnl/MRDRNA2_/MRDRNA2_38578_c0_seq2:696-1040(-)